jgi:glutathione S-transferase
MLENNIQDDGNWTLGASIGLEDIAIWRLMGWLSSGVLDGIPSNIIQNFPKITRVCLAVDKEPKIQEWISKTYPENYVRGNYL